jgi:small subunit ribosomal protein S6
VREYETVFVLDVGLEGDAVEGEIDRVVKLIEEKKGKVHDVQRWGRRRLAYPIAKKSDGIYTLVRFDGHNELLGELDRRFSLNEALLRHMTVSVEHPDARKVGPGVEPSEPRGGMRDRGGRDDRRREGPRRFDGPRRAEGPRRSDDGDESGMDDDDDD